MIAVDEKEMLLISGNGDVIEPDQDIISIGSGSVAAQAAASVLVKYSELDAKGIVTEAMTVAASLCIYTNDAITLEML